MADGPKNSGMYTNVKKTPNCRLYFTDYSVRLREAYIGKLTYELPIFICEKFYIMAETINCRKY